MNGKSVFINYWYVMEPMLSRLPYYTSILPGLKNGISGSMTTGVNIGIRKNIPKENLDGALEILRYVVSKDTQRKTFANGSSLTAISEFLEDEELCKKSPCHLIKEIQCTGEPKYITDGPENYSKKFKTYIYEFLYENKTIEQTIKHIEDVTKIYYVSLSTENTSIGLVTFIIFSVFSVLMLLSLIIIYNKILNKFYTFLPNAYWIITILGSILILWVPVTSFGPVEKVKCHLKVLLLSIGYSLSICPTFSRLIGQFPEDNRISTWVANNKYLFIAINILVDILLNGLSLINPYTSKLILIEEGESFEICQFNGLYIIILLLVFKLLKVLLMTLLLFIEWNNSDTVYDMKFIMCAIYINILSAVLFIILYLTNIKKYILYFLAEVLATFLISISNYIFLYSSRLILKFIITNEPSENDLIRNAKNNFANSESQTQSRSYRSSISSKKSHTGENGDNSSVKMTYYMKKMIDYHYSRETRNSFSVSATSSRNSRKDSRI